MRTCSTVLLMVLMVFISSCNTTKYLKSGETFYGGSEIKFDTKASKARRKTVKKDLEVLIQPKPNTKIFGIRPGVWFYYRQTNDERTKGLKAFIRKKLGQAPVLLSDATPRRTAKLLAGHLENNGHFKSEVDYHIKEKKKESTVIYDVKLRAPYHLKAITYPKGRDSTYAYILRTISENSLLKPGQRYELARLKAEQQRIETEVKDFGLYFFDDRYLIFEADSTVGAKEVDLDLKLEQGIPERGRRIYTIDEVNIYPEFTLDSDTAKLQSSLIVIDSMNYYDYQRKFRPNVITRIINLHKGDIFTSTAHSLTLSHLMDLGVFKFVNVQFEEVHPDSSLLQTNVFLTPLKKKSIRGEFQAVSKSNNFVGPGFQLTFTNRNFFGGAELFQVRFNTSYEVQLSRRVAGALNSFELGLESSITVPRFITPIRIDYSSKKFLPKTDLRLGVNIQNRVSFFRLNSFNIASGYLWRESEAKSHEFYPADISYVRTDKRSEDFRRLLETNPFLGNSFQDQFIIGTRYSYTINTQLSQDAVTPFRERQIKEHSIFFNGNVQVAGNAIQGIQGLARPDVDPPYQILGSPYSQFVRGDVDFRYYWQLDQRNKLASRVVAGTGYAYGNSETLPYIRQFSIGGSNSIRAFPARSLGPGTFNVRNQPPIEPPPGTEEREEIFAVPLFIDQRADIKLETNVEWRFDVIGAFKGALFVDAGNIWLWKGDSIRGGQFDSKNFLREFAVGTGVGFRFDFSFFVLRFDVAFPIRKPFLLPEGDPWVFNQINFASPAWRRENLIFNIAIGYPF